MAKTFKGIDVSQYQQSIDFKKVKASGVDFVIIRAGFGKYANQKDPYFEKNYKAAKAAGLKVGAYWYSYAASVEDAKAEAQTCINAIKGKTFEYPIYFDLEERSQFARVEYFATALSRLSAMHLSTQAIGQDCISAVRLYSSTYLPLLPRDMLCGSLSTVHAATLAALMVCGSTVLLAESAVSAAMLIWTSAMWTILRRSRRQG